MKKDEKDCQIKDDLYSVLNNSRTIIVLSIIYLIFHSFFEKLFSNIFVEPIISSAEKGYLLDVILLVGLISICINFYSKIKRNYYVVDIHFVLNIILLFFYFYYRIQERPWQFLSTESFTYLAYLDFLPVLFVSNILMRIIFEIKFNIVNSKNKTLKIRKGFNFDNSLGKNGVDCLHRSDIAKNIAENIAHTYSECSAFTIGIVSEWGGGKTSFLDLIKESLSDSVISIDFNPWLSTSSSSISKNFFYFLGDALNKYNSSLSKDIKRYSDIVTSGADTSMNNLIRETSEIFMKDQLITDEFKLINNAIKKIGKKVVVFVDDIDRLNNKEIFEIIRIIRIIGNFSNLVFIAAYEREYLINAISKINSHNPNRFLEKVFQLEIVLPNFEEYVLKDRLIELLDAFLSEEDKEQLNTLLFPKTGTSIPLISKDMILSNYRDVTRFSNSFILIYKELNGEVCFPDLFRLELLRYKFLSVYRLVFLSKSDFIIQNSIGSKVEFILKRCAVANSEDDGIPCLKEYLMNNKEIYRLSEKEVDDSISLLRGVFYDSTSGTQIFVKSENEKRARIPEYFQRYSHYRLLDSDLSEKEFVTYWNGDKEQFKEYINEWVKKGFENKLKTRFELINGYSNKEIFEKAIECYFYLGQLKSKKKPETFIGLNGDDFLDKLIYKSEENIDLFYDGNQDEYNAFITSLFNTAKHPYLFEIELVFMLLSSGRYDKMFNESFFDKIRLKYLSNYLKSTEVFNKTIFYLYRYCDVIVEKDYGIKSKTKPNSNAIKIIYEYISNIESIDDFIFSIIVKSPMRENSYGLSDIVYEIFDSLENLVKFIEGRGILKVTNLEKEFVLFLREVARYPAKEFVPFKFSYIRVD